MFSFRLVILVMFRKFTSLKLFYAHPQNRNHFIRLLSTNDKEKSSIQKVVDTDQKDNIIDDAETKRPQILAFVDKFKKKEEKKEEERKGPFKNYYTSEERDKNKIMRYEEFIDRNTAKKDKENFIVRSFGLATKFQCNT